MNSNIKEKLLTLLSNHLGVYSNHSGDETSFHCPFCHHHKKKLAVNLQSQKWQCWVCNSKGNSLYGLFKALSADDSTFIQLRNIVGETNYKSSTIETETEIYFSLPEDFIPLIKAPNDWETKNVINYLKKRGITKEDIIKYNIGYCAEGLYKNYVIIPSYDENGKLNYFVARNYYNSSIKYKNPPVSKDTVIFENTISYELPIVLVEGVFDAISVKRNVIPLLGKRIQPKLYQKLLERDVKKVYIMLDNDARKEALDIAKKLMQQHINVYVVELNDKDPNDLGFIKVTDIIKNTDNTDFSSLIKLQFA
jgi:DNA primase